MPVGGERCRLGDDGLDRRGDRPDHARKAVRLRTHQAYPAAGDLPRGRPHTPRAVSITPFHYANMCSTRWVDPGIRRAPTGQGRCEPEGLHIKHAGDIPVTVKVTWTDGTEAEVNAWTSQWTHTTSTSSARRHPRITRSGCERQTSGGADRVRCRQVPQMVTQVPQSVGRSGG